MSAAAEQVRLRRRAAAKFGESAPGLRFTEDSPEPSPHVAVSAYEITEVLPLTGGAPNAPRTPEASTEFPAGPADRPTVLVVSPTPVTPAA
ncbi:MULTISPECIES: hypothetical protein [unclassified Streptomyces]|uniref:hypothetical protein n=1 Tax=unclassified Streptomyces TaxID=2593676 RepID=UPI0013A70161|nr:MULTISPECIES: hypothetical protein [unclassified Streptomyces]